MQHGSFPVINPLNETFPDRFYLERTQLKLHRFLTNNGTITVSIEHPLPGDWYIAAILGDYVDDSIKQKVLITQHMIIDVPVVNYNKSSTLKQPV